ncbi:hypothetical protein OC846_001758 [Tilletia horrida]|uniref:GST N-terminal domain-containing protein n=1 Tax=Tilletia horrida TaxID=155126 RepID=A0AAN6GSF0_9BASI|nr:hypothetical protein OC845_002843 [Tilletia horrida]KAK0555330.1 hypothetical protein OC846_001758 [Tilletia horrida]KAK0568519.1 hypothetical protein OC861_001849 [Tilletia horrida]
MSSSNSPIVLYDVLPNTDSPSERPYALLPNPWITRLVLKQKNIPFTVKPITVTELRASGPGSFRDRLASSLGAQGRPLIPMIEHNGKLIGDNQTIADYLDKQFPDSPSAFLPEITSRDAAQNQLASSLAWHCARQLRNTIGSGHAELIYEQATAMFDPVQREWMRSDEKIGLPGAMDTFRSMNRADLLASTRGHLAGVFSILSPIPAARIEGLEQDEVPNVIQRPADTYPDQSPRLFLSSPTKPGFADFTVFGWFLFTYIADRRLNEAIWTQSSGAAREWLEKEYNSGQDALKGDHRKPGYWPGDIPLRGVPEWADRMLSLYDNYTRRILDGEVLEGEPKVL